MGTRNGFAAIPSMLGGLHDQLNLDKDRLNLVVPLGITLCRYGSVLVFSLTTVFAMYLYNHPITVGNILITFITSVLAAMSTVGLPGLLVSTVTSYGIIFLIGGGTGFLAAFLWQYYRTQFVTETPMVVQFLQDINPVLVLLRILGQEAVFGKERELLLPYWGIYTSIWLLIGSMLIAWAVLRLNPQQRAKGVLFRL